MAQLERCPFCGSREADLIDSGPGNNQAAAWVCCRKCGATGPGSNFRDQAVKKWNERADLKS